jgi:hypothetical protein
MPDPGYLRRAADQVYQPVNRILTVSPLSTEFLGIQDQDTLISDFRSRKCNQAAAYFIIQRR